MTNLSICDTCAHEPVCFSTVRKMQTCIYHMPVKQTCNNVWDEEAEGTCLNGFQCSVCGEIVSDYEDYCVMGTWNFCPNCGRKVVDNEV